jgi:DNA-nicking Smr family endonuclease
MMTKVKNTHSITESLLSDDDATVWNTYIQDLWSRPEAKFQPKKGHDYRLKFSLDLHGMTIQQAFNATKLFVDEHRINGSKSFVIISGKSGKIADELPFWVDNIPCVRKIEPIIDSQGASGAYIVYLYARK